MKHKMDKKKEVIIYSILLLLVFFILILIKNIKSEETIFESEQLFKKIDALQIQDNKMVALSEDPKIFLDVLENKQQNYINIIINDMTVNSTMAQIFYKLRNEEFTEEQSEKFTLEKGNNYVTIPTTYEQLRLDLTNEQGVGISLDKVILTNKWNIGNIAFYSCLVIIYLLCQLLIIVKVFYYRQFVNNCRFIIKKLKKILYEHPIIVLSVLMLGTTFFVYFPYLFQGKLFIYSDIGSDTKEVYYPFFVSLCRKIGQGDFSLWDFTYGTGVNILSRQADVGNIFSWLMFLAGINGIKYVLIIMHILKILLCGYFCYLYLNCFGFSNITKVVVAYIYAFNGFMILWGQHYFFGNASIYVIMLLFTIEKALKSKKGYIYTAIAIFLILCNSYYIGYMILLFAGIYTIFRLMCMYTWKEIRQVIQKIGGLLCSVIIGTALSSFIFLPSVALILNTSARFESDLSILEKIMYYISQPYDKEAYIGMISRMFSNNFMGTTDYTGYINYYEMPQFFFTCFNVVMGIIFVLEIFFNREEKRKTRILKIIEVCFVIFLILNPVCSVVLNGFVGTFFRYTYILMPVFALCYAEVFDKLISKKISNRKNLILCACTISFLLLLALAYFQNVTTQNKRFLFYLYIFMIILFSLLMYYIQNIEKQLIKRSICIGSVILLIILNVSIESYVTTNARTLTSDTNPNIYQNCGNDDVVEALSYIQKIDQSFYRVEKTFLDVSFYNDSLLQGYYGVSTYNSVLTGNLINFASLWEGFRVSDSYAYESFRPVYNDVEYVSLLGIKYILSKEYINDVPEYVYMKTIGNVHIYHNIATEGIGKFYTKLINYDEYRNLSKVQQDGLLNSTLIINDFVSSRAEGKSIEKSNVSMLKPTNSSYIEGTIDAKQDGWVFVSIPYEEGWKAYIDGEEVEILQANIGYSAVQVEEGEHQLLFEYETPLLKEGIVISCFGVVSFILWCIYLCKKKGKIND